MAGGIDTTRDESRGRTKIPPSVDRVPAKRRPGQRKPVFATLPSDATSRLTLQLANVGHKSPKLCFAHAAPYTDENKSRRMRSVKLG